MPLQSGTRLGPYEVLSPLGAGGMGEVYKAKDARLDRFVAIKVLPEHLAASPDALARFEREAKAVAALNHPNILAIHDLGHEGSISFVVMELLEGESLRARLSQGPLPLRKAVDFASQIAQGLAAAHSKGVIHRDLKPENLWITKEGRVKILDFGLAKVETPVGQGSQSLIVTEAMPSHHTEKGAVLGTVAYMSPEQVRGEAVDGRSDLFSFGVVLYEMLSGKRAFSRNSPSETLAAILRDDPPELDEVSGRPLPGGLRRVLDHCLEKDPELRFHDAQDLAFAFESISGESAASPSNLGAPRRPLRLRLPLLGAAVAGGVLAAGAMTLFRPTQESPRPVAIRFLTHSGEDTSPAASPDGRTVAFTSNRDGHSRIWVKALRGGGEAALSSGPDDFPRFSPDGSSILFTRGEGAAAALYRMSVLGTDLHRIVDQAKQGDWSPDGTRIAFVRVLISGGDATSSLCIADASGGDEREVAKFPSENLAHPRWSPDGGSVALVSDPNTQGGLIPRILVVRVKDGSVRVLPSASKFGRTSAVAWKSPTEVLYAQAESVTGNGVSSSPSRTYAQNLDTGIIRPLFWAPVSASTLDLLPDGRVVFDGLSGRQDLREIPLGAKGAPRWITQGNSEDRQPVFSRDGEWVIFSSNRSGNLDLWAVSTRTGVVKSLTDDAAEDWDPGITPDGARILWSSNRGGAFEIWMANLDGSGAHQVSHDGVDAENPTMTKDSAWIVYASSNARRPGLWKVHPDGSGAERIVAGSNMLLPEVSPDGRHVVFVVQINPLLTELRAVEVDDGSKEVFRTRIELTHKRVSVPGRCRWTPDGRRVIFTGQDANGNEGVFIQDFEPGKDTLATRRPLAGFDPDWVTESLGLSPDGSRLVLSESERMFSLLVAEHVPTLGGRLPR